MSERHQSGERLAHHVDVADVGVLDSPEEVLTTLRSDGKRKWMYPSESRGRFWRRRQILGWALIALFVALPIVKIKGKPAVLLDVAAREFTLFGTTFYPTDTLFLMLFGISALVSIALLTALLGRVWCGYACPQTVFLEGVPRLGLKEQLKADADKKRAQVRGRLDARKKPKKPTAIAKPGASDAQKAAAREKLTWPPRACWPKK